MAGPPGEMVSPAYRVPEEVQVGGSLPIGGVAVRKMKTIVIFPLTRSGFFIKLTTIFNFTEAPVRRRVKLIDAKGERP